MLSMVWFNFNQLFAQSNQDFGDSKYAQEKTLPHLVKSTYLAGEIIWFSFFVVNDSNNQLSSQSKIVYAELVDAQGTSVMQQKLQLTNGVASGSWEIPALLPSSIYVLRGFVASEKSHPDKIKYKPVFIFNPAVLPLGTGIIKSATIDSHLTRSTQISNLVSDGMNDVKVDGLQKEYKSRQKVNLALSSLNRSSFVAVAVYRNDEFEKNVKTFFETVPFNMQNKFNRETFAHRGQEYFGHQVIGIVSDRVTGKPIEGVKVYCSVNSERFYFGSSRSNKDGLVRFDVGNTFGSQQLILQLPNQKDSNAIVQIQTPFLVATTPFTTDHFSLHLDSRKAIEARIVYANLKKAFGASNFTFILPNFNDSLPFYGRPDKTYFLDDYTRFNTMEEVLREYVVEVELRKQGQQYRFAILDIPNKRLFEKNPLVLIDGVPTNDINKVVGFDPLKVKRMDIVSRKFFMGDESYDGIVSLITYNGDLGGFELNEQTLIVDYPGLPLRRQFEHIRYESEAALLSRLPDLRSVLCWSPIQKIKKNQSTELSFFTSDWEGEYILVVAGVDEKGDFVNKTFHFSVIN